jgi:hypothetical protein
VEPRPDDALEQEIANEFMNNNEAFWEQAAKYTSEFAE